MLRLAIENVAVVTSTGKWRPTRSPSQAFLSLPFVCLLLLLPLRTALAQQTDFQSWTQLLATVSLDKKRDWFASLDVQPRIGHNFSHLERLILRPGLGYNINEDLAIALGYAWTPSYMNTSYIEDFRDENRIWQTIAYRHSLWGLDWQHRLRQEQRFIQHTSGTAHRSQYVLRGSYPFPHAPQWGLTGYGQLLVNENSVTRGPQAGFDRTRAFFGPFFISGPVRYEVGYMGEYAPRFGDDSRVINALMVSAQLTL
jgi:hypothetical protein